MDTWMKEGGVILWSRRRDRTSMLKVEGLTSLLKNGGQRMYVDLGSHGKSTESGHSIWFQ